MSPLLQTFAGLSAKAFGFGASASFKPTVTTWYQAPAPVYRPQRMVYGDGTVLTAAGNTTYENYKTNDGISWTRVLDSTGVKYAGFSYNGTYLFAVHNDSSNPGYIQKSADKGLTWTNQGGYSYFGSAGEVIRGWADATNVYVKRGSSTNYDVFYQAIGTTNGFSTFNPGGSFYNFISVVPNASGINLITGESATSGNYLTGSGTTYTLRSASANMIGMATWDGNRWVGVANGNIWTTPAPGTAPTFTAHGKGTNIGQIVYADGVYLMGNGGDGSYYWYSTDLITWTSKSVAAIGGYAPAILSDKWRSQPVYMPNVRKVIWPTDTNPSYYTGYILIG